MRRHVLNLLTTVALGTACVFFVWGLLYDKFHVAGWPRVAKIGRWCTPCGYDMRATPDRRPQCGKASTAGLPPAIETVP